MKTLALGALLLAMATPAAAGTSTYQFDNGERLSVSCRSGAYGAVCRSWWNGTGNSASVTQVAPVDFVPNTNPDWGKNCRSCADLSK